MKTILLYTFFSCFGFVSLWAQKFDKVSDYHNFFIIEFNNIQKLNVQYTAICVYGVDEEIVKSRQNLQKAIDLALKKYDKVSIMPQDQGFRLSVIQAMQEFKEAIASDYKQEAIKKAGCTECFERVLYEREFNKEEWKQVNAATQKINDVSHKFQVANNLKENTNLEADSFSVQVQRINRAHAYSEDLKLVVAQVEYDWEAAYNSLKDEQIDACRKNVEKLKIALTKAQNRLATIKKITEDNNSSQTLIAAVAAFLAYQTQCVEKYFPQILSCFDANNQIIDSKIKGYNNVSAKIVEQFNSVHGAYVDAHNNLIQAVVSQDLQKKPELKPLPNEKNSSTQK